MGQYQINCKNCGSKNHRLLVRVKGDRQVNFISDIHNVVVCEDCGLAFLNPQHDDEDYAKYYTYYAVKTPISSPPAERRRGRPRRHPFRSCLPDSRFLSGPLGRPHHKASPRRRRGRRRGPRRGPRGDERALRLARRRLALGPRGHRRRGRRRSAGARTPRF